MLRNNFYKTSYVDMGETCSFCRRTSKKNEIMKIAKLPNILIISLQRINPKTGMKNNASVKFYEGLDLKEIIDPETQRADYTKYDLFAVSNHIGKSMAKLKLRSMENGNQVQAKISSMQLNRHSENCRLLRRILELSLMKSKNSAQIVDSQA